ncbi:MAG: phosphotransferase family protein [Eubacteriales bacterium]
MIYVNPKTSFDEYPHDGLKLDTEKPLNDFQKAFVLRNFPGRSIVHAEYTGTEWLPCPVRITLDGGPTLYLKVSRHRDGVRNEAMVLPLLKRAGLAVPELIAGPVLDPDAPNLGEMTLISELDGQDALSWYFAKPSPERLDAVRKITLEGVARYHALTPYLLENGADRFLPTVTLADELDAILARGGEWFEDPRFCAAVAEIEPKVRSIDVPLVFTNGDIHPGNFLQKDGALCGFIDFTHSSFKDPLYGFATYIAYDMKPFECIIDAYLAQSGQTWEDFNLRLKLRILWVLQREVTRDGDKDRPFRDDLLKFLES